MLLAETVLKCGGASEPPGKQAEMQLGACLQSRDSVLGGPRSLHLASSAGTLCTACQPHSRMRTLGLVLLGCAGQMGREQCVGAEALLSLVKLFGGKPLLCFRATLLRVSLTQPFQGGVFHGNRTWFVPPPALRSRLAVGSPEIIPLLAG